MVKLPPWQCPEVGSCAFLGRPWQLWLARRSQGRDRPTGRPATASSARVSRPQSRPFSRLQPFRRTSLHHDAQLPRDPAERRRHALYGATSVPRHAGPRHGLVGLTLQLYSVYVVILIGARVLGRSIGRAIWPKKEQSSQSLPHS